MLVDTSVLLRTLDFDHPHLVAAERAIRLLPKQGRRLHIVAQNLIELWAVATRSASQNGLGLSPAEALDELSRIKSIFTFLDETPAIYPAWEKLVTEYQVTGKSVHDARLVAAMQAHGLKSILTFDKSGFARYAGIEVVEPQQILPNAHTRDFDTATRAPSVESSPRKDRSSWFSASTALDTGFCAPATVDANASGRTICITASCEGGLVCRKSIPSAEICRLLLSSLITRPRCFKYHITKFSSSLVVCSMVSISRIDMVGLVDFVRRRSHSRHRMVLRRTKVRLQPVEELGAAEGRIPCVLIDPFNLVEFDSKRRVGQDFVGRVDLIELVDVSGFGIARMVFLGLLGVRRLNRLRIRTRFDAEHNVVIQKLAGDGRRHTAVIIGSLLVRQEMEFSAMLSWSFVRSCKQRGPLLKHVRLETASRCRDGQQVRLGRDEVRF